MTQTPSNIWGLKQGFILASRSPKRLELLKNVGLIPEKVVSADIDETPLTNELPARYVRRISAQKAQAVMQKIPRAMYCNGRYNYCRRAAHCAQSRR